MKRLFLCALVLFGLVFNASAYQRISKWVAKTDEDKENVIDYCALEMKIASAMGWTVVCFDFTEDGYLIVFEDHE